jgi:DNA polymerase-3 subunit delta'
MPLLPVVGHESLQARLRATHARRAMPASVLLHGDRGVGKQRLALWIGAMLLCTADDDAPCGRCQSCSYVARLVHPDLYWFFPIPRADGGDRSTEEVIGDARAAMQDRATLGAWPPSSGMEAHFVDTVRGMVKAAGTSPSLARRKVLVVGDAERMVAQAGADQAANAFLKLLEEPPTDTTIILTSSEPGALLPTIRSRVVALRVPRVADDAVHAFAEVAREAGVTLSAVRGAVSRAAGAPGVLLAGTGDETADSHADAWLAAARGGASARFVAILSEKQAGARGPFSDALDSLATRLHVRARTAAREGRRDAARIARLQEAVDEARARATGNVNPSLITAQLLRELADAGVGT